MPKVEMNYSKTIIYKIVCKDVSIKECYVGQTTNFTKRKNCHKSTCNNLNDKHNNLFIYQFIREHNGWDNWDMIEIEKYNASDKLDAGKRERYWIETLQSKLNQIIPTRTEKEYYVENKDKKQDYLKEYYEENKVKLNKSHKEYYVENKDIRSKFFKEHYEQNKDKIEENRREQITCICGSVFRKDSIRRHIKTKKHIEFVKTI